jgi:hypothetical protein
MALNERRALGFFHHWMVCFHSRSELKNIKAASRNKKNRPGMRLLPDRFVKTSRIPSAGAFAPIQPGAGTLERVISF